VNVWETLEGHFTFPDFYRWLALQAFAFENRGSLRFVEVGVLGGQSAAFLAQVLAENRPSARLDLVDTWPNGFESVRAALSPFAGVIGEWHQGISWEVAQEYDDVSVDAVFLDADHDYESVARDIAAWRPKLRPYGILAGHDYTPEIPGVIRAVTEAFDKVHVMRGERFTGPKRDQKPGNYYPVWFVRLP